MSPRDLVYVGHMLDMTQKAVAKVEGIPRDAYDADENLRLALIHLAPRTLNPKEQTRRRRAGLDTFAEPASGMCHPRWPPAARSRDLHWQNRRPDCGRHTPDSDLHTETLPSVRPSAGAL